MNEYNEYIKLLVIYFKYKPLEIAASRRAKKFYEEHIPSNLNVAGAEKKLYDLAGNLICRRYNRIVIGDYGAYVEFNGEDAYLDNFKIKEGQEFRLEKRYEKCKYIWLTTRNANSSTKIYLQTNPVAYADYIPGKYYISIAEIKADRLTRKEKRIKAMN